MRLAPSVFLSLLLAQRCLFADPSAMRALTERLGSEEAAERSAAAREICARHEEWSPGDLAILKEAGQDKDAERAAAARVAHATIERMKRIGPQLVELWDRVGDPQPGDEPDRATEKLLEGAAYCWRGGSASDAEVSEFVEMIRKAGGDPVASCPVRAVGKARCRPMAPLLAERLRNRLDNVDVDRAKVISALGLAGDGKYGDLLDGYVFGPPDIQRACLVAAKQLHARSAAAAIARLSEIGSVWQRVLAVEALGTCATEKEWPALRLRLMDPVPAVRSAAARAVGVLRPDGGARWVAPLLRDRDHRVVLSATIAFAALAEPASGAPLYSAAFGPGRRGAYLLGEQIAKLRPPGWKERLLSWLEGPDSRRRDLAADGLSASASREAGPALLRLADPTDFYDNLGIYLALMQLDPPGVVDCIGRLAGHPNPDMRAEALEIVEQTRGPRWTPLVSSLLDDPSAYVVGAALEAAPVACGPELIAKAEKLLSHEDGSVRCQAAEFLGKRGERRHVPALVALLGDEEAAAGAAEGLANLRATEAVAELRTALKGPLKHLRGYVAGALACLGSTDEILQLVEHEEDWWFYHDRFLGLPPEGVVRIAPLALERRDGETGGWSVEALITMDGGRLADWAPADRRDFQRRVRNLASGPDESTRIAATTRLVEWGLAGAGADSEMLEFARRSSLGGRMGNAFCVAFAARHEPAWSAAAHTPRVLERDLASCQDVEEWAAAGGAPLDMSGYSTLRTWRKGCRATLREILEETVEVSDRTVYVEGGKARIVLVSEAIDLWRKRLER